MNAAAQLLGMLGVIIYEFSSRQPFAALCQLTLLRAGLTDTVLKTAAGAEAVYTEAPIVASPGAAAGESAPAGLFR